MHEIVKGIPLFPFIGVIFPLNTGLGYGMNRQGALSPNQPGTLAETKCSFRVLGKLFPVSSPNMGPIPPRALAYYNYIGKFSEQLIRPVAALAHPR